MRTSLHTKGYLIWLFPILIIYSSELIAQKKKNVMTDDIKFVSPGLNARTTELSPEIMPLHSSTSVPRLPKALLSSEIASDCIQPYSNFAQNSRSTGECKVNKFEIKWKSALRPSFPPSFIIQNGNRILIEARVWQLFNENGILIRSGDQGTSHFIIEKKNKLFFYVNKIGELTGCQLENGAQICASSILYGDIYVRPFMTVRNQSMFFIENERQLDPHMHHLAKFSNVSKYNLHDIFSPGKSSFRSAKSEGYLSVESNSIIGAGLLENMVFSFPDKIIIANESLSIIHGYGEDFKPVAISTDEAGRIYLLNDNDKGRCLWVISKAGEKLYSVEVPGALIHPPIVGYDHRVFIPCEKSMVVIEEDGEQLMNYRLNQKYIGAVITADDKLLICDGHDLRAFNKAGEAVTLFRSEDGHFSTPPVITETGNILVASKEHLYCLTSQ